MAEIEEELLKEVQGILTEEKFTRAALNNYSISQFKDMDILLKKAQDARAMDEVRALCDEHLLHTKNSIKARYLSGMIAISRQLIDDLVLIELVNLFVEHNKWNIVKYLCERILEKGESKYALRTLAECYKNEDDEDSVYSTYERLVKIDLDEADITKQLAERYESKEDVETATDYYKKAIIRYINKSSFAPVRDIWAKILKYHPEEIDFFMTVQEKVAKEITSEKAASLLQELYETAVARDDIDTAIGVLKKILTYDERDTDARREITECYRIKYKGHSRLEDCVKISNLGANYRNVHEAIQDFEKHIAFDKGNFVFHRTWGVGRIAKVETNDVTIDFAKKRGHTMALKMAVDALTTLSKDHIWVLKATWKKEKLSETLKKDHAWALKTIIKSFGNSYDVRKLKAELVPSVLSESEWLGWNNKARKILKTDPSFGVSPDSVDVYSVRERQNSLAEKLYNEFKAEKKFLNRVDIIRKLDAEYDSETDTEMMQDAAQFFASFLKSESKVTFETVGSYLLVRELAAKRSELKQALESFGNVNFITLFENIQDVSALYTALKDKKLQDEFLREVRVFVPSWQDVYAKLFPAALKESMLETLMNEGFEDRITNIVRYSFNNYRDARGAVLWFYKKAHEDPSNIPEWYSKAGIKDEKVIATLLHILDTSFREIENHFETADNKKLIKAITTLLFDDGLIYDYIEKLGAQSAVRVNAMIDDVQDMDPKLKLDFRKKIEEKYPEIQLSGLAEKDTGLKGLMVTLASFEAKKKELDKLMNEDIPLNAKEIAFALSLGDLRENAEFKAAKEKQTLLNSTVGKLKNDLDRAQLFNPESLNTQRVSFGTKVKLQNLAKNTAEEYTILGPWESDPVQKVISYLSPFGSAVFGRKVGEKFEFKIADEKASYEVLDISGAKL